MNPLRLRARSYRSFDELDLEFPDGCCAITGANGAGKSSIVNAIDLALFGPQSRTLADLLTDDGDDTELMLELAFEHSGSLFRVRRSYSARGRGQTKLDFEQYVGFNEEALRAAARLALGGTDPGLFSDWSPLTRETARETQQLICDTLGLARTTFRASSFLAQGDSAAFTEADPRARKQILAEILGLHVYDRLHELAKTDRQNTAGELERVAGETAAARGLAEGRDEAALAVARALVDERLAGEDVVRKEAMLAEITARYQEARESQARKDAALAEVRAAQAEVRAAEEARAAAMRAARAGYDLAVQERARARHDLEALVRQRAGVDAQAEDLAARAVADRDAAAALEYAENASCQTCGQPVKDAAKQRAVAVLLNAATEHEGKARTLAHESDVLIARINELTPASAAPLVEPSDEELAAAVPADILDRIASARREVERLQQTADELTVVDPAPVAAEGAAARQAVEVARAHVTRAQTAKTIAETHLRQIEAAEAKLEELAAREALLRRRADLYLALERAFGKDGIPALIVENAAIPQIEAEANRILDALQLPHRVELRTQRANKTNENLADTLDVIVAGDNGSERPYESFSGGERSRLNVALRIALARLLAHRRGAESRVLVLDEVEYLDEAGQAALSDVLRGLQDTFSKIILVSHVVGLRDAFDTVLQVEKVDGRSCIVGAPEREAVAA